MKKFLFLIAFLSFASFAVTAQTRKIAANKPVTKTALPAKPAIAKASVREIPADEWNEIVKTIEAENWNKSSLLTLSALKKLKTENEKKQLARLRYFYIYSLTGKIAQKTMLPAELERISQAFIGQDFLMPSREVLSDCTGKVNYICTVKADENSLRVTATSKSATVHSFEYIKLPEKFDVSGNSGKKVFLGGKLKNLEIGTYKNDIKIVKLSFEEGFADIVSKQS